MKAGDLIYDAGAKKYAIVLDQSKQWTEPPGNCEIYYFWYFNGTTHQIWWHTYTADRKKEIKVISSRNG